MALRIRSSAENSYAILENKYLLYCLNALYEYSYSMSVRRAQRLAKEGGWVIAGQTASIAGALMLVRVLTEYLEPGQYGQLALGMTIAGLVNQVITGGIANGIGRFYSIASEQRALPGYLHASYRLMLYATIAVLAIALVLMVGLLWLGYSQWMGLTAAALVFSILNGFNSSLNGIQNAARQRAIVAFHGGLNAWIKILLALGVMLWLGNSSTAVVIGYALSSLFVTSSQLIFLRHRFHDLNGKLLASSSWGRQIWSYSWPFSVFGVFTWAQQISDRWALQAYMSMQEVGLYAVVYQLGYAPIGLATGMAMTFLGPILYQRSGSATDYARNTSVHLIAWRFTSVGLFVTAIACVSTYYFQDMIFNLFVASQYHTVSYLLPWMVLAGGIFAAGQMLALKLMSEMRSSVMAIAKIVTAILGIVLNFYGASRFGVQGVVAALVMFSAIYFIWMALLAYNPIGSIKNL